jgi:hypothetical protein
MTRCVLQNKSFTVRLEKQRPRFTGEDRDEAKFMRWEAVERERTGVCVHPTLTTVEARTPVGPVPTGMSCVLPVANRT